MENDVKKYCDIVRNASKIACRILMHSNKEYPPVLEWNFNSLKLAIDTMFALNETSECL